MSIRSWSRNGGEHMSAELDGEYKRLRRVVGYAGRTKRSGIMRKMPPVYARAVRSEATE